jgi:hypothetical protein
MDLPSRQRRWFRDGSLAELFVSNHKSNLAADVNARDAVIAVSLALQSGVDVGTIRRAFCRGSYGRASGPLGTALDSLAQDET